MKKNYLKYNTEKRIGNKIVCVHISLDDDCKNGHADFSMTGEIYNGYKSDARMISGGCCHEEILAEFPEFKMFADLHLSDCQGTPMYAVENGYFFFKRGEYDKVRNLLRLTDEELSFLVGNVSDKEHFAYQLHTLGLPKRWKSEADEAIKKLEELVEYEYEDTSTKLRGLGLTEEKIADIERKESEGYYTTDAIAKRRVDEFERKKEQEIAKLVADFNKVTEKARVEMNVKIYILNYGLPIDNFIYYNHRNVGVFNWLNYMDKITQEQFVDFYDNLDRSKLPEGIDFEIKL